MELGLHGAPWVDPNRHAHLVRAAKMAVWGGQTDAGHGCPISMTYAVIPALRHNADLAAQYEPLLTTRHYDSALKAPPHQTRIDRRYVDDGKTGRFGCSCRNHKGSATIRRQLPADGPQVVHLRADVGRVPRPRPGTGWSVVLLPASGPAGRLAQQHVPAASEGQVGQSFQRE